MVQRHARRRFTLMFCSRWCKGFAPHTASTRLPIPWCAPLHHWRRDRDQFCRDEESCEITYHDESSCMTHGGVVKLVLRLAESVCVSPWPLVWWCKGTYGGASLRDFGVCGAKASHHKSRTLAFRFHGVCLCTTGEETAVSSCWCCFPVSPLLAYGIS